VTRIAHPLAATIKQRSSGLPRQLRGSILLPRTRPSPPMREMTRSVVVALVRRGKYRRRHRATADLTRRNDWLPAAWENAILLEQWRVPGARGLRCGAAILLEAERWARL